MLKSTVIVLTDQIWIIEFSSAHYPHYSIKVILSGNKGLQIECRINLKNCRKWNFSSPGPKGHEWYHHFVSVYKIKCPHRLAFHIPYISESTEQIRSKHDRNITWMIPNKAAMASYTFWLAESSNIFSESTYFMKLFLLTFCIVSCMTFYQICGCFLLNRMAL